MIYYMIVENTYEVLEIGEFVSLIDANKYVDKLDKGHFDQGHGSILINEEFIPKLIQQLDKVCPM